MLSIPLLVGWYILDYPTTDVEANMEVYGDDGFPALIATLSDLMTIYLPEGGSGGSGGKATGGDVCPYPDGLSVGGYYSDPVTSCYKKYHHHHRHCK